MISKQQILQNLKNWVEALKSGKYKQGKGTLSQRLDGNTYFCCLGVACEVLNIHKGEDVETGVFSYDNELTTLPKSAVDMLGISPTGKYKVFTHNAVASTLVGLNDIENYNFAQIADVIRIVWIDPLEKELDDEHTAYYSFIRTKNECHENEE